MKKNYSDYYFEAENIFDTKHSDLYKMLSRVEIERINSGLLKLNKNENPSVNENNALEAFTGNNEDFFKFINNNKDFFKFINNNKDLVEFISKYFVALVKLSKDYTTEKVNKQHY